MSRTEFEILEGSAKHAALEILHPLKLNPPCKKVWRPDVFQSQQATSDQLRGSIKRDCRQKRTLADTVNRRSRSVPAAELATALPAGDEEIDKGARFVAEVTDAITAGQRRRVQQDAARSVGLSTTQVRLIIL